MKSKDLSGGFGKLHFIRRKKKDTAYDMATITKIELEKVIGPFKEDLKYTADTLMKNWT